MAGERYSWNFAGGAAKFQRPSVSGMGKKGPGPGIWEEYIRHFVLGCRALPANAISHFFCDYTYSTMSRRGEEVAATGARTKKGRNFCPEEEEQCCRSFMHTSTDARRGIGQKMRLFGFLLQRIMQGTNLLEELIVLLGLWRQNGVISKLLWPSLLVAIVQSKI
jgi:hypothetical protein